MRGISTILATILIVIIVVALISLTYTFATGLLKTATGGAQSGVETATKKMDQRIVFVTDPTCTNISGSDTIWEISFTIRHDGATYSINASEISAFFGNTQLTLDLEGVIDHGATKPIKGNATGYSWDGKQDTFTVSAPAGPIDKKITCHLS
jgi:FlaG/FlaF family flagellin (archaellin)